MNPPANLAQLRQRYQHEKQALLKAPRERVWRALSEAQQFGIWFGVRFDGPFAEGKRRTGRITPTQVDAEVAAMQAPYVTVNWFLE